MNWLQPKLNLRVAQKQILTPGLVQMVSVLALNRLELREMINQEIMANPVLEEVAEDRGAMNPWDQAVEQLYRVARDNALSISTTVALWVADLRGPEEPS